MPWSELVELLGGSAIALAVLAVFWKGDDCISKEFRDDLAAWLILLKPPPGNSPVAQSVLAMFEKAFSERHWSWKCFRRSFVLSVVFLFFAFVFQVLTSIDVQQELRNVVQLVRGFDRSEITFATLIFIVLVIQNGIGDYPSLLVTRKILQKSSRHLKNSWMPVAIIADLVLSVSVFIVVAFLLDFLTTPFATGIFSVRASIEVVQTIILLALAFDLNPNYTGDSYAQILQALSRAWLFTALITSFWLWAAAFGTLVIRLLARSGPILVALQYALPIEDKPIRSMGIAGFLIFFVFLLVSIGLRSVGLMGT